MKLKKVPLVVLGLILGISSYTLGAELFEIDKAHSRVGFSVKHMVISTVQGEFTDYSATMMFDENDVTKSSLEGTIKVASINTGNEQRDSHLRSSDFFDAEKYPEITFKSEKVIKKNKSYLMIGDLTMRGMTKKVEIPFTVTGVIDDPWGNRRVGIEANLTINRMDYGVAWSQTMDKGGLVVAEDVKIELSVEATKKRAE
jgi:polyisoprenoid-binding protein YceI